MNVFTKDLGIHQGRIALSDAPDGSFVYELGHALLRDSSARVGDYHEVKQIFVMTDASKFIKASVVVKTPPILPVGDAWLVSAWLNNVQMVDRRLRISKRVLILEDWRVSLAAASPSPSVNVLAFRLELV